MSFQLVKSGAPPAHTPQGQQPNFGPLWLAVAHTPHGNVPAKAANGQCWYPYGGKEHQAGDFSWVVIPGHQLVRNSGGPVPRAVACGFQNDAGQVWGVIAHTQFGDIPAKAIGNSCWFPYGGQEHTTNTFSWIVCPPFTLLRHNMCPNPTATTPQGHQPNFGPLWCAVAHCQHGTVPGKASGNQCWYPYGGHEHSVNDFSWVDVPGHQLVRNTGSQPHNAIVAGRQNDGAIVCIAIAHTPQGNIPGKAMGNNCWYSFGGAEVATHDFSWVVN